MKFNIFTVFLDNAKLKYTGFSYKYYEEHPYKYSMLGLSMMLNDYGIANKGVRTQTKDEAVKELVPPYIAHINHDFVNVYGKTDEKIFYIWRGVDIRSTYSEFVKVWDGIALIAEPDETSGEPNYGENKRKDLWHTGVRIVLGCSVMILCLLFYWQNVSYSVGANLLFLLNIVGIYIGHLLAKKQLDINSRYADKLCSLFSKSDCNNVLDSKAARLWGLISWSEIGLGYFISNMLILLFTPQYVVYMALLNLCTVPYAFWSIWFQKVKVKQWCPLCLLVQTLFLGILIVDVVCEYIFIPLIRLDEIVYVAAIYAIPFMCIHLAMSAISDFNKKRGAKYELESLKMQEEVFVTLLKKQTKYPVSKSTSQIIFGNPNADLLISVFSNPHCEPCGRMHKRLRELQKKMKDKVCIQYIFSSFGEDLNPSNKFLISVYQNNTIENSEEVYDLWFNGGKYNTTDFFNKYQYDINAPAVDREFRLHEEWKKETKLMATPTILINGYELPDMYEIEDLIFFKDLRVEM